MPKSAAHARQYIVCLAGAGEHPGNIELTRTYADWYKAAGATVFHREFPDVAAHSRPPDYAARLPEWLPRLLRTSKSP